jgi:hypothetical protein
MTVCGKLPEPAEDFGLGTVQYFDGRIDFRFDSVRQAEDARRGSRQTKLLDNLRFIETHLRSQKVMVENRLIRGDGFDIEKENFQE